MKKYLFLSLAALLFAACSNDSENVDDALVPLHITGTLGVETHTGTRAYDTSWETGDAIGVYATATGTTTAIASTYNGSNTQYTLSGSAGDTYNTSTTSYTYISFSAMTPVYLPSDGSAIDVYAYYPYSSSATTPTAVPVDVSTQTTQNSIDLMRASATKTTQGGSTTITKANHTCELLFAHKLCKLQFNIKAGTGMAATDITGNTVDVKISGQETQGTYNIYTDALTITDGHVADITALGMTSAATGYDKSFEAIILPNGTNNEAAARTVTITIGTATYTCSIPTTGTGSIASFTAGNKYEINITVNISGLTLTAAITPWTTTSIAITAQ